MQTPLSVDTVLVDRFCILKVLHQSAAGWVYLTIDQTTKGFYVLEEVPVIDSAALPILKEQFAELLSVLKLAYYQSAIADVDRLFLVRDYVEGHSYRELFEQNRIFSEKEVLRFLKQILLLLRSLHRKEIAHQNLTFNSIVQRLDGSLMLAEFTEASFVEQEFDVDLYALAVMSIVLLTGCEPKELYDEKTQIWKWHDRAEVQPRLKQVLDRMLSPHPQHRYPSAAKVLQALSAQPDFASIVFTFVLIGLAAISAYRLINHLSNLQPAIVTPTIAVDAAPTPKPKETAQQRSNRLGLRDDALKLLLNRSNRTINQLLDQLEPLSQEARSGIGTYKRVNYDAWLSTSKVSQKAIELLTDAQFVLRFPEQKGKVLNPRTSGQIWYAIARDQITKIQPETLSSLASGTLKNGTGKVYRASFKQGQTIKLNLKSDTVSVWIFSADTTLLKNFSQSDWMGKVNRSSNYEIVIVPNTIGVADYELSIDISSASSK
ncbi:serine/threonine protein kinase [Leptolyngbya sp. NIES-3755]|nr:serine/threonine protein kinase [Leptolyngbya sp. NIES-3755]